MSFPRQNALTRRFSLGAPRDIRVSESGDRVAFLRSPGPTDPSTGLWVLDPATGIERLVVDPAQVGDNADLPAAERARRERARESAGGIVAYDADPGLETAVFALGGRLHGASILDAATRELPAAEGAFDPRLDPTGRRVAYVSSGDLHVVGIDGEPDRVLAADPDPGVSWGVAEFAAAEELGRGRGFWWAPDGERLLAARVDDSPVGIWWVASLVDPADEPRPIRYPAAGTANSAVGLAVLGLNGSRVDIEWTAGEWEYLVHASWAPRRSITLLVLTRDQATAGVLDVDPDSGRVDERFRWSDTEWIDVVPGTPTWWGDRLVVVADDRSTDTRRVMVDGAWLGPAGLQVRRVVGVGDRGLVVEVSADPTETHVVVLDNAGSVTPLTGEPGVHSAVVEGAVEVVMSRTLERHGVRAEVRSPGRAPLVLADHSAVPVVHPRVSIDTVGARGLRVGLLLPDGDGPFPVLLDPYGGPHHGRVVRSHSAWLTSQWFADQGFAVVVTDNRGTPGRGPAFERSVYRNFAGPVLEDQIDALHALAKLHSELDLDRVGIRGWSFGGYLAALAVLRRPDVFRAAVAGAPVTDWRLYDTAYTERYLGHPAHDAEAYRQSSLLDDAASLSRPLMLVHGLADDNVVVAHTLAFSRALTLAARPHTFVPLPSATHMAGEAAEALLQLELAFLREHLGASSA